MPSVLRLRQLGLVVLGLMTLLALSAGLSGQTIDLTKPDGKKPGEMMKPLALDEALKKARVDGKYECLLHQIKVEKDQEQYKGFHDLGLQQRDTYAGQQVPRGYWVYVYPYWYIWRDLTATAKARRAWGHEQATGLPDTDGAGDIQTAWASRTQDDQDEWLMCEYADPVMPTAVIVHETYNPGSLYKVSVFKLDGTEVEAWKGKDPTSADEARGVSVVPIKVDFKVNRVKIYLKSTEIAGWNEIDAVGLKDKDNRTQWAQTVEASTNYATEPYVIATAANRVAPAMDATALRLERLERDIRELKEINKELLQELKELKAMLKKDK